MIDYNFSSLADVIVKISGPLCLHPATVLETMLDKISTNVRRRDVREGVYLQLFKQIEYSDFFLYPMPGASATMVIDMISDCYNGEEIKADDLRMLLESCPGIIGNPAELRAKSGHSKIYWEEFSSSVAGNVKEDDK